MKLKTNFIFNFAILFISNFFNDFSDNFLNKYFFFFQYNYLMPRVLTSKVQLSVSEFLLMQNLVKLFGVLHIIWRESSLMGFKTFFFQEHAQGEITNGD